MLYLTRLFLLPRVSLSLACATTTTTNSARGWAAPTTSSFHVSAPRKEEEKEAAAPVATSSGLDPLYAIPIGVACAVPILEFEWFDPNAETLLASTFLGFCVVAYTQGGEMMSTMFKDEAKDMLKAQNEAEGKVIAKLEESVEYMKLTENIVEDYQAVYDLTEESYAKLNASGKIKPQHKLKSQVEKLLGMIAAEETNAYEKAKIAMMAAATEGVTAEFTSSKELKKAALTAAIGKLTGKGGKAASSDPVKNEFVKFFQATAQKAKAADDGSEEKAARATMITKMNAVAENENMYFRLDATTGKPMLV